MLSTIIADRGPRSAESIWGADFAIVAVLTMPGLVRRKAVLGQAKRGSLDRLSVLGQRQFSKQIRMMHRATWAIAGLEVPEITGDIPRIRVVEISTQYGDSWAAQSMLARQKYEVRFDADNEGGGPILLGPALDLGTWIVDEVVYCSHGDENERLVAAVSESSLQRLQVNVSTVA